MVRRCTNKLITQTLFWKYNPNSLMCLLILYSKRMWWITRMILKKINPTTEQNILTHCISTITIHKSWLGFIPINTCSCCLFLSSLLLPPHFSFPYDAYLIFLACLLPAPFHHFFSSSIPGADENQQPPSFAWIRLWS